jgi:hypothetical protein
MKQPMIVACVVHVRQTQKIGRHCKTIGLDFRQICDLGGG